jgi:flagellar basal-body rod protein FlgB
MAMFVSSLLNAGATPALVGTLSFNHQRLKMLAENIANYGTPHYRTKQLDTRAFQRALREALDARRGDPRKPFEVKAGREVVTDERGNLHVAPSEAPGRNILFHDGTNMSIERQMADLAETGMTQELVSALLKGRVDALKKAIRGTL